MTLAAEALERAEGSDCELMLPVDLVLGESFDAGDRAPRERRRRGAGRLDGARHRPADRARLRRGDRRRRHGALERADGRLRAGAVRRRHAGRRRGRRRGARARPWSAAATRSPRCSSSASVRRWTGCRPEEERRWSCWRERSCREWRRCSMPERTPYIAANWKMHKTVAEAAQFVDALLPRIAATQSDVVICPPFLALSEVVERSRGSAVRVAAQNMHEEASGAFTGEVSAPMLVEVDVDAVVLGHSERRQHFGETDEALARKVPAALAAGLEPILCVGESEEARDAGADRGACWSASCRPTWPRSSRPSWPGSSSPTSRSGRSAPAAPRPPSRPRRRSPSSATRCASAAPRPSEVRILYGGSVKPGNAAELMAAAGHRRRPGRRRQPRPRRLRGDRRSGRMTDRLPVPSLALVILDGWGLAEPGPGNAISLAETPVFDRLWDGFPHTQLSAQGRDVGLPDGQMGNSEVGHLNLGAGAIVKQDLARIDDAIADGSFFENEALLAACERARNSPRGRLHLLGLVSDGGVHSGWEHIEATDRAGLAGGRPRRRLPRLHRRPRHPAARRPRLPRRAGALAAPGRPRRHRQRPLLRDGPRHPLGADQARLRRDRPRRGAAGGRAPRRRSRPPTSAARPTSSSSRP